MGTYNQAATTRGTFQTSPKTTSANNNSPHDRENCSATEQLLADIQSLYNNRETSDVVFVVGQNGVEIYAHKILLWARCQHFKKLYSDPELRQKLTSQRLLVLKYQHYDPVVFGRLIRYIYTGKIHLEDKSVFSFIVMAKEFGLPELLSLAEEYVGSKLCVKNACLFMNAALHLEKLNTSIQSDGQGFTEVCARFIEDHAEQCITTEAWLELPKPAVIKLISSQKFSLEEDKVWNCILSWAKYNSGIPSDKPPKQWNPQEKQLVAQALDGVTEHIKLFLISSQLFAEEVEPTGLVPMETVLERYRYAAVAAPVERPSEDVRLCPRTAQQYFRDSTILCGKLQSYQLLLNQWYGSDRQTWRLLYRGSRDGFHASDFHRHCDGQAPTFTIVKGSSGSICGGFSDVPWCSKTPPRGRYIPSHRAFLFTLVNFQDVPPTQYKVSNSVLATLHHQGYGPTFGGGADLSIASDCNVAMESYSNFPHSYSGQPEDRSVLMGDYNFNVRDYEVYTVVSEYL